MDDSEDEGAYEPVNGGGGKKVSRFKAARVKPTS
jgi:hypothetical protein